MKILKVKIARFRGFQDQEFELGSMLTAIAGQNGTQKSTLLGIITQTFTLNELSPMRTERPLCGGSYISAFSEKFRLSPTFDKPKEHEWTLSFDDRADFTVESIAGDKFRPVRFWQKGKKSKGDGYINYPTIFLSLKRLLPAAEERGVATEEDTLTAEEISEFKRLHDQILIIQDLKIDSAPMLMSKNKQSIGVNTNIYDWRQNSMGQDNIGKIILALFSFARLKKKYPSQYQGGILAIDELDATMYPASQVELLKELRKYASKLNLQIVFTTHSITLLKSFDELREQLDSNPHTKGQQKMVFLKKVDQRIEVYPSVSYDAVFKNLTVTITQGAKAKPKKIVVYTEDKETAIFAKAVLKTKSNCLHFIDVTLPCSTLLELSHKGVPAFKVPQSLILLDGDVRLNSTYRSKMRDCENILVLPGSKSPERLIAEFLHALPDADPAWDRIQEGYNKQLCFRTYHIEAINAAGESGRQIAKSWFNEQLPYWGKNGCRVIDPLMVVMKDEKDAFFTEFESVRKKFIK